MPRNVKTNTRIESVEALVPKAAALADQGPIDIVQDDAFFRCESGRHKLREFSPTSSLKRISSSPRGDSAAHHRIRSIYGLRGVGSSARRYFLGISRPDGPALISMASRSSEGA